MNRARIAIIFAVAFAAPGVNAQNESMTRAQGDEIIRQLRIITEQLARNGSSRPAANEPKDASERRDGHVHLTLGDAPFLGAADAPLVVVEFTDFQCPFCQRFHSDTFNELKKNYIDTGKVRYFSRDLPLDIHPNALQAAAAGKCAGEQGQFWAMHDRMQENPTQLDLNGLVIFATELGIDAPRFRGCVESGRYKQEIQRGAREATENGARGTPAFLIGHPTQDGAEGEMFVGAMSYATFDQRLKAIGQSVH